MSVEILSQASSTGSIEAKRQQDERVLQLGMNHSSSSSFSIKEKVGIVAPKLPIQELTVLSPTVFAFNDAVYRNDTERVRLIMNEVPSAAFWRKVSMSYNNYSPLHYAASTGNADLALTLIDGGFAVDVLDGQRRTPLMWASSEGHENVALELLELGAVPNFQDLAGETALHKAARGGHARTVQVLLENSSRANTPSLTGESPLMAAVTSHSYDTVLALLRAAAHVNAVDEEGDTALHWNARAADAAHLVESRRIHDLLLQAGAQPSILNSDEESALDLLAEMNAAAHA